MTTWVVRLVGILLFLSLLAFGLRLYMATP